MWRLLPILMLLALPADARAPVLRLPVECTLGEDCQIRAYVDHDFGPGAADLTCGPLSYDGNRGTDFALPSLSAMRAGAEVIAAAPGKVISVRDGMEDVAQGTPGAPDVTGRECGNGVIIDHGGGWQTQYCHLAKGSVAIAPGRRIGAGTPLGRIGLSGDTRTPQLSFILRHDGEAVDPFLPDGIVTCGSGPRDALWAEPVPYRAGGFLSVGIANRVPETVAVEAGTAGNATLPRDAPRLVLWAHVFGARAGDRLHLALSGPGGAVIDETLDLRRTEPALVRSASRSGTPWPVGQYSGRAVLIRDGVELDSREVSATVGD